MSRKQETGEHWTMLHITLSLTCVSKVATTDCNCHEWPNAHMCYVWKNTKICDPLINISWWNLFFFACLTVSLAIKNFMSIGQLKGDIHCGNAAQPIQHVRGKTGLQIYLLVKFISVSYLVLLAGCNSLHQWGCFRCRLNAHRQMRRVHSTQTHQMLLGNRGRRGTE